MIDSTKIIFCTDGIFPHQVGGMQRHSRLLIEALSKNNSIEIIVIHPHKDVQIFHSPNVIEYSVSPIDDTKNYLKECYQYSKRVYEIIIKYPNHIVYSQGLSVWYKSKTLSSRLIVNPHGLEPFQSVGFKNGIISFVFKKVFKKIFRNASYVVSLGGSLTDILSSFLPKHKLVILPNAIDAPTSIRTRTFPDKDKKIHCFFVARFAHNKGIHILLEAIRLLNEDGFVDKFHFTLAGKGPLYESAIQKYNFSNVTFLGFVTDKQLEDCYLDSDVFVFPTLFEGMPTVVLEAMSYSLPIIVTNTGATTELVDDSNGYIISRNSVEELKNSLMDFLLLDYNRKKILADNSYNKVTSKFTWDKVAERYLEVFSNLASK